MLTDSPNGRVTQSKVSQMASMFSSIMQKGHGSTVTTNGQGSSTCKNRFVKNKVTTEQCTFYGHRQMTKISSSSSSLVNQRSLSSSSLYSNLNKNDNQDAKVDNQRDDLKDQDHSSSCQDISLLIDNKAKFSSAKALFEQLEKQAEKFVISTSKMYNNQQTYILPSTTNRPSLRPPQLPPRHFNELMFTGGSAMLLASGAAIQKKARPKSAMVICESRKNDHVDSNPKILEPSSTNGSVFTLVGSPKMTTSYQKVENRRNQSTPPTILPMENFADRRLVEEQSKAAKAKAIMEKFVKEENDQSSSVISQTWRSTFMEESLETKMVNGNGVEKRVETKEESVNGERSVDYMWLKNGEIKSHLSSAFVEKTATSSNPAVEQDSASNTSFKQPANEIMPFLATDEAQKSNLPGNGLLNLEQQDSSKPEVHYLPDGHFWMEIPGVSESSSSSNSSPQNSARYKKPTKVSFSGQNIKVYSTYSQQDYDRRNDEIDPVSASAEYELERRLERMELLDFDVPKGDEGLGFSIIGMGVGADAGLEKLGIFVKSITPGGSVFKDGQIKVCDQIVEVDGQSLIGVSQSYAADVLRATSGVVRFKIGRENDPENSEIAQLIKQSLDQDKMVHQTSAAVSPKQLFFDQHQEMQERSDCLPPPPPLTRPAALNNAQTMEGSLSLPNHAVDQKIRSNDDDETPEQLVDSNPHIEQLMKQLRKAFHQSESPATSYCNKQDKLNSDNLTDLIQSATAQNVSDFETSLDQFSKNLTVNQNCIDNQDLYLLLNKETHFPNRCQMTTAESSSFLTSSSTLISSGARSKSMCHVTSSTNENGAFLATPTKITATSMHNVKLLEENLLEKKNQSSKYQAFFDESTKHYVELEEKYNEAKNMIENYQAKERSYLEREESHLRSLLEKDKQYAALLKQLNDKVIYLENQLRETYERKFFDRQAAITCQMQNSSNASPTIVAAAAADNLPSTSSAMTTSFKATPVVSDNVDGGEGDDSPPALAYLPSKKLLANGVNSGIERQSSDHVTAKTTTFTMSTTSFSSRKVVENQTFDHNVHSDGHLFDRMTENPEQILMDDNEKSLSLSNDRSQNSENCTQPLCIAQNPATATINQDTKYSRGSPPTPRRLSSFFAFKKRSSSQQHEHHVTLNRRETLLSTIEIDKSCFSNDIFQWKSDDVCKFLQTLGLDKYSPEFCINKIDGKKLLHLDGSKLKSIGVENQSDRALIKKGVKELKNEIRKTSKAKK